MTCDGAKKLISSYLQGKLDTAQIAALARHLERCADCRQDFEFARLIEGPIEPLQRIRRISEPDDLQRAIIEQLGPHSAGPEETVIIKIAHSIIYQAIQVGATEIFIEPDVREVRILFRFSGPPQEIMSIPKSIERPLLFHLKCMADIDGSIETMRHGRIPIRVDGYTYSLEMSIIPVENGERVVMRISEPAKF